MMKKNTKNEFLPMRQFPIDILSGNFKNVNANTNHTKSGNLIPAGLIF